MLTGHGSVIASTECQARYIVQMVVAMRDFGAVRRKPPSALICQDAFELKSDAERLRVLTRRRADAPSYNLEIQRRIGSTVFAGLCDSFYKVRGLAQVIAEPMTDYESRRAREGHRHLARSVRACPS